jgi:cytochrome c biogenesis protein CcdA/thiol-disulfide isomerase/thioredoxin
MTIGLLVLAFAGGALTIISPCILPVLPFIFARQGSSFARSTLPLLVGMALTFAAIATLAAVGGAWAVRINSYGRIAALALLAVFGVALLSERVADAIAKPFVSLGNRLTQRSGNGEVAGSIILGVATGFLWAPCAGPILGLILTGAALEGPSAQTSVLLLVYGLGAATSLALARVAGGKLLGTLKRGQSAVAWVRRALGVAVLAGVCAIALGWDTGLLTKLSLASTNRLEQSIVGNQSLPGSPKASSNQTPGEPGQGLSSQSAAQPVAAESLSGADAWLNSAPLTLTALRGKVVLIDFWTYSCINCLRTLPYLREWDARYKSHGLTIIGVHSPEFAFEKDERNVTRAVHDLGITYPVAIDSDYAIWRAFSNQYWPAHYLIDATGHLRGQHFGEGAYDETEQQIRQLLTEAGAHDLPAAGGTMQGKGFEAASDANDVASPETYVGYDRAEGFASPGEVSRDQTAAYRAPATLELNHWALAGSWTVGAQDAVLTRSGGKIVYRFHARDLHLVLAPSMDGTPIRFRVLLDGKEPAGDHGTDIDEHGTGTVSGQRLYQLIRQSGTVKDRTFTIEFLDPGVHAYSFTFG